MFFKTVSSGQREFVYNEPEFRQFLASVVERLPSLFSATSNSPLRKLYGKWVHALGTISGSVWVDKP